MAKPLRILLAVAICLVWSPVRADEAALRAACDALDTYLSDPANCAPGAPCERSFSQAVRQLLRVKQALDDGKLDRAVSQLGSQVSRLQRAGFVTGTLELLVQDSVNAADGCVVTAEQEVADKLDVLCATGQQSVERRTVRAAQDLVNARSDRAIQDWSQALRDYSRALRGYAQGSRTADRMERRCRPRACRSTDFVVFSPGGGQCLTIVAADRGTEVCYEASGLGGGLDDIQGSVCMLFQRIDRAKLSCDLETFEPGVGTISCLCSGSSASVRACLDSNGWSRISSVSERLRLECSAQGMTARVSVSTRFSFAPPTVIVLGELLPVAPAAVEFCIGDVATELDIELKSSLSVTGLGRESVVGSCDLQHTVEAIENVTVLAGTFPTARIRSTVSCAGGASSGSCTTWIGTRIGIVQQSCIVGGVTLDYELESVSLP